MERYPDGNVLFVYRTTPRGLPDLLEGNRRSLNESDGQRFGDGKIVGRIPLNVLYGKEHGIAERMQAGDSDHLKWWLNSEAAKPFRTFRGRV